MRFLCIFAALWLITFQTSAREWIPTSSDIPLPVKQSVENRGDASLVTINTEGFFRSEVQTADGPQFSVHLPGGVSILQKDYPDIPRIRMSLMLPEAEQTLIRVVNFEYMDFEGVDIAPSKGHLSRQFSPEDVAFAYGPAYSEDAFWPDHLAEWDDPFIFRDVRGQTLNIYPVQYNPVKRVLRIFTELTIELLPQGTSSKGPIVRDHTDGKVDPAFHQAYQRLFSNYDITRKRYPMVEEYGSMLIICYDEFMDVMRPFLDWKKESGRAVTMVPVSQAGNNPAEIKEFLVNYYNNHPDFTFLLLVGDAPDKVPVHYIASSGYADNWYGFLDGDDAYNEVIVGRFSAQTIEHVETQVWKSIQYERDLNRTDTWLAHGMGIARNEGPGHHQEMDYEHMDFIRDSLLNYTYELVYREYDNHVPNTPNTSPYRISTGINNGVGIINYCNHGEVDSWSVAGYHINNVNNLRNNGRLPFIWSVACLNGAFVGQTSFAEAWMWATNEGEPSGAVGTLMSTINQDWIPPMSAQDEMVTILVEQRPHLKRTFGGLSLNGSLLMVSDYGVDGKKNHETWTLFGDPSLMIRTAAPEPLHAIYDSIVYIGTNHFAIESDAEGAMVALSRRDYDDELILLGTASVSGGQAIIYFDQALDQPGEMTIVITGHNRETYINDNILIKPPDGPYTILNAFSINDSRGAEQSETSFGELISLNLEVSNIGNQPTTEINMSLETEDPYVSLIENSSVLETLAPENNRLIENIYRLKIDENIPDGHKVNMKIVFCGQDGEEWTSPFHFFVRAPELQLLGYEIDDTVSGNNNGIWDQGEIIELVFKVKNQGSVKSPELWARSSADQKRLLFPGEEYFVGSIHPGQETILKLLAVSAPELTAETIHRFTLELFDNQYYQDFRTEVRIGKLPVFLMNGNHFVSEPAGVFYDSGGAEGNYSGNESYITTFYPPEDGSQMVFVFDSFHLESGMICNNDFLNVHNGPNTNYPLIGTYCGTDIPDTIMSDNAQGAITFHFQSNQNNHFPGWKARFYSTVQPFELHDICAYPRQLCLGEKSQLSVMAGGLNENTNYSWSPATHLDDPNIPYPSASPSETTEYKVEITRDGVKLEETVLVEVHPLPEPFIGDTLITCMDQALTIDAGAGYTSYLWSDGSAGQSFTANYGDFLEETANIGVLVSNQYGCKGSDQVHIIFDACTSVRPENTPDLFRVFPNPASEYITIIAPDDQAFSVQMFDIHAKPLFDQTFHEQGSGINVSDYPAGIYLLRIVQGVHTETQKIQIIR